MRTITTIDNPRLLFSTAQARMNTAKQQWALMIDDEGPIIVGPGLTSPAQVLALANRYFKRADYANDPDSVPLDPESAAAYERVLATAKHLTISMVQRFKLNPVMAAGIVSEVMNTIASLGWRPTQDNDEGGPDGPEAG